MATALLVSDTAAIGSVCQKVPESEIPFYMWRWHSVERTLGPGSNQLRYLEHVTCPVTLFPHLQNG